MIYRRWRRSGRIDGRDRRDCETLGACLLLTYAFDGADARVWGARVEILEHTTPAPRPPPGVWALAGNRDPLSFASGRLVFFWGFGSVLTSHSSNDCAIQSYRRARCATQVPYLRYTTLMYLSNTCRDSPNCICEISIGSALLLTLNRSSSALQYS